MYSHFPIKNTFRNSDKDFLYESSPEKFFEENNYNKIINNNSTMPNIPAPNFLPEEKYMKTNKENSMSLNSIKPYTYRLVYIWTNNGNSFWAWLVYADEDIAYGYRWKDRSWIYFGLDSNNISNFQCYDRDIDDSLDLWDCSYTTNSTNDFEFNDSMEFEPFEVNSNNDRSIIGPYNSPFNTPFGSPFNPNQNKNPNKNGNKKPNKNSQDNFGPTSPPPNYTPKKNNNVGNPQTKAVSPGSIRPCVYQFVYIWLNNGNSFWAWLTRVDNISASGFRWTGWRWVYFGVDLRRIDSFECYGRASEIDIINTESEKIQNNILNPKIFKIIYPSFKNLNSDEYTKDLDRIVAEKYSNILLEECLLNDDPEEIREVYGSYSLTLQTEDIASFIFYIYFYKYDNSQSIAYSKLTLDYKTNEIFSLGDFFEPSKDYMAELNKLILNQAQEKNFPYINNLRPIDEEAPFALTSNSLVFYIDKSKYNPNDLGLFEIYIPYTDIQNLLSPSSPINKIINNNQQ